MARGGGPGALASTTGAGRGARAGAASGASSSRVSAGLNASARAGCSKRSGAGSASEGPRSAIITGARPIAAGVPSVRSVASSLRSSLPETEALPAYSIRTRAVPLRWKLRARAASSDTSMTRLA